MAELTGGQRLLDDVVLVCVRLNCASAVLGAVRTPARPPTRSG
jgi:hypothetical protein